jgi:hypothetical protein
MTTAKNENYEKITPTHIGHSLGGKDIVAIGIKDKSLFVRYDRNILTLDQLLTFNPYGLKIEYNTLDSIFSRLR